MNNKGFTLTELIVTMVLIGIVTLIALPSIAKLQSQNKNETYYEYEKVIITASKLYVDKYNRDLWGTSESGCRTISYQNLKNENLLKDYKGKQNENVVVANTFINATKNNSTKEVTYQVYLEIKNTKTGVLVYKTNNSLSKCS